MTDTELSAELQALLPEFIAEVRGYLDDSEKALEALACDPKDTESQTALFRLFHTIKGTARFFSLTRLEKLVHTAENVISLAQKKKESLSPEAQVLMKDAVSRVRYIIDKVEHPHLSGPQDDEDLINRITILLSEEGSQSPETSPKTSHIISSSNELKASSTSSVIQNTIKEDRGHIPKSTGENSETANTSQKSDPSSTNGLKASSTPSIIQSSVKDHMVRIPESILDQLLMLSSELIPTYNQIETWAHDSKSSIFHNVARKLSLIANDLQDSVLKARLQPIRTGWRDFPKKVESLAAGLNKKIVLKMDDHNLKLDRHIIETLKGPLTHIMRNALDHGIEPPAERVKANKPEQGTLSLSAQQEGPYVIITIYDDGRGLNIPRIREKAKELGLYDKKTLDSMSDEATALLLLTSGFSTAQTVTELSGRGIGLDAARDYVIALGGNITLSSEPGKSTTVTVSLPLTVATIKMLIVRAREFRFALPQNSIRELFILENPNIKTSTAPEITWGGEYPFIRWENQFVPIVSLAPFLKLKNTPHDNWESVTLIIISPPGYAPYCLLLDHVLHMEELLIKALPKFLRLPPVFSGQGLLGDGSPILILDTTTIAQLSSIKTLSKSLTQASELPTSPDHETLLGVYLKNQQSGSEPKLIPLGCVLRIETFTHTQIQWIDGHPFIPYYGYPLPCIILEHYPLSPDDKNQHLFILISDGIHVGALPVHTVYGLVSPNSFKLEGNVPQVIGNTIWSSLDVSGLLQSLPHSDILKHLDFLLPTSGKEEK